MKRRCVAVVAAVLVLLLGVGMPLASQEISEKKDIAIFNLSYTDWTIPSGALGLVDQKIQNVFVDLGRFNILGLSYRLQAQDIQRFIDKVKELKQENVEIPEEVRLGEETFTEQDMKKLVGSFIVVVPVLSYYDLVEEDDDEYKAELQTSFTFIKVEESQTFASFQIDTTGYGESGREAVKEAVDAIPMQLQYELRSIPEFQLKTGIIDVVGNTFVLEFGRNMGVRAGDEYAIVKTRILPSGRKMQDEAGLLTVKNVGEEVSEAAVRYSDDRPAVGDQLREIPRFGFESAFYFHMLQNSSGDTPDDPNVSFLGLRLIGARGFYSVRPYFGVELPIGGGLDPDVWKLWIPVITYAGAEMNWFFGRLHITPAAAAAYGQLVPLYWDQDEYWPSHIGGIAHLNVSYLVSRDVKVFVEAGGRAYFSITQYFSEDLIGPYIGAGVTLKF
jgi:hypothetical protein